MAYTLEDLDTKTTKGIFDGAYIETRIDGDGDLVVSEEGMKILVKPSAKKGMLKLFALFGVEAPLEELLVFCNRFNDKLVMVRASARTVSSNSVLVFDYDLFVGDGTVEGKTLVTCVKRFADVIQGGIKKCDEGDIF